MDCGSSDVALVAILIDDIGVSRRQAGEAEHLPRHFVAIAAIDRIAEETLHGEGEQTAEERLRAEIGEFGFALLHLLERLGALVRSQPVEVVAVGFARPVIGGGNAGGEELGRRQRELIALFRLAFEERAGAIRLRAAAPGAGELAVDIDRATAIAAGRRQFVGGNKRIDRGDDEGVLGLIEDEKRLGVGLWR